MKGFVFLLLFLNSVYGFSQELRVGVITSASPFSDITDNGKQSYFFGFSIDVMSNICKQLKWQCSFQALRFDNQFSSLRSGKIDLLLLATPYQLSLLNKYAVSLPYLVSKVQFVALNNSPIQKGSPIAHYKIGVLKMTFYDLLRNSPYQKNNQLIPYNNLAELVTALSEHRVDLILLNSAMAFYYRTNNIYEIKSVSKEVALGDGYGIIAMPENAPLISAVNKAILNMQSNGSYLNLYNKYHDGM